MPTLVDKSIHLSKQSVYVITAQTKRTQQLISTLQTRTHRIYYGL